MSEILLQAIVEKLESLELALLKQNNADKDEELKATVKSIQSPFIKSDAACDANNKKIDSQSEEIHGLQETNSQVRHTHHFHKHVGISVSLFIISLLLAYAWLNCSNEKKFFKANNMKCRNWKANGNLSLLKLIYYTDSLYNLKRIISQMKFCRRNIKLMSRRKFIGLQVKKQKT